MEAPPDKNMCCTCSTRDWKKHGHKKNEAPRTTMPSNINPEALTTLVSTTLRYTLSYNMARGDTWSNLKQLPFPIHLKNERQLQLESWFLWIISNHKEKTNTSVGFLIPPASIIQHSPYGWVCFMGWVESGQFHFQILGILWSWFQPPLTNTVTQPAIPWEKWKYLKPPTVLVQLPKQLYLSPKMFPSRTVAPRNSPAGHGSHLKAEIEGW